MSYLVTYDKQKDDYVLRRIMMLAGNGTSYEGQLFKSGAGIFDYRHIRLSIYSPGRTMQFSNMFFQTSDGIKYSYPDNFRCWVKYYNSSRYIIQSGKTEDGIFFGSEIFSNVLNNTNSMSKVCWGNCNYTCSKDNPIYFYIDLKDRPLNIKRYNYWGWHTSNDTTGDNGSWERNMKQFSIEVSNADMDSGFIDEKDWQNLGYYEISDYDREFTYGKNLPKYAYAKVGPFKMKKS